jgi:predicted GH43/DUF377 family glycosyl hydrolase
MPNLELAHFRWRRDPRNPVLPPGPAGSFDSRAAMNPFVLRLGDEYRLYYAGGDATGGRRICLATARAAEPTLFTRHGPVLERGPDGAFDCAWCVLPFVRKFADQWRLYYAGRDNSKTGLQSFHGTGLALSDDGLRFTRYSTEPIVTGDQTREFPKNRGIAGVSALLDDPQPDGSVRYRMYYTLAVGTPNADVRIDQEKHCAVAHSADGIHWTDHRVIMGPRRDVPNEDIAVAAPVVWRDGPLYRMLYCGIGTRWGYYSISEAVSADGYQWHRGKGDENLSLAPDPDSAWEKQMVEYPAVIREGNRLRLYYCGNGYGATGIGTAVADL